MSPDWSVGLAMIHRKQSHRLSRMSWSSWHLIRTKTSNGLALSLHGCCLVFNFRAVSPQAKTGHMTTDLIRERATRARSFSRLFQWDAVPKYPRGGAKVKRPGEDALGRNDQYQSKMANARSRAAVQQQSYHQRYLFNKGTSRTQI